MDGTACPAGSAPLPARVLTEGRPHPALAAHGAHEANVH